MLVKDIKDEDFINYKKPSMLIAFPYCDFKCDRECGRAVCQNSPLINEPDIEIGVDELIIIRIIVMMMLLFIQVTQKKS